MTVTTRARYSLRAMIDIAQHQEGGPVRAADIAERQRLSCGYLERVLRHLVGAGLIQSRKGPGGGYELACAAESISLADVFRASGEELLAIPCISEECDAGCPLSRDCPARAAWAEMHEATLHYLGRRKLGEFLRESCRAGGNKQGLRPLRSSAGKS